MIAEIATRLARADIEPIRVLVLSFTTGSHLERWGDYWGSWD
jgi:hypothetical protein